MCGYLNSLSLSNNDVMSKYWAHVWYLFESLQTFNSLYGETYSMLLRNYGILISWTIDLSFNPNYQEVVE
ncbi:hypothetical protein T06_6645 [Trichinella sp. T6]|nr:hypothetical protein T06_6645 [Trichinella sp. T6]